MTKIDGELRLVEDVRAGDEVLVHPQLGFRTVAEVRSFDTLGIEKVECFVVVYRRPGGLGNAWENKSSAAKGPSTVRQEFSGLAPLRRGEKLRIRRAA